MRGFRDPFTCLSLMDGKWELDMRHCFQTRQWLETNLSKVVLWLSTSPNAFNPPPAHQVVMWALNGYSSTEHVVLYLCSEERGRGGTNRLKIVSKWQHMIEFPGLWKFTLIIQRSPSVIFPWTHFFAWKCEWLQLIYIILLLNWHGSGESGLGKLLRD